MGIDCTSGHPASLTYLRTQIRSTMDDPVAAPIRTTISCGLVPPFLVEESAVAWSRRG